MNMKSMLPFLFSLLLWLSTLPTDSAYYTEGEYHGLKEKVTHLHFFLHDILSGGPNASAFIVARANITNEDKSPTPFGTVLAIDDPLREGPEATSKVIGNAQGLYVSSGRDKLTLVLYVDFGFTTGEFNGSSISVFSRNPITEDDREVAVVGGRKKFRFARGFAKLKSRWFNVTNGDAVIEYNVTVFHY